MTTPLPATRMTPYVPAQPGESDPRAAENNRPLSFLSLRPHLFLVAFNPALLPLIFTIVHIAQTCDSTADLAAGLKDAVQSACAGVAQGAASFETLPRYLVMQTNEATLKATRATVLGAGLALIYAIEIIMAVVNFIVDTHRSFLLCTIQLVVQGTLDLLISAVKEISDGVTSSLNAIRSGIQDDIASTNNLVQKAVSAVSSVLSRIGIDFSVPEMTIPKLSWLENVTIPDGVENSLLNLNASLPDQQVLQQKMEEIIDMPFDLLVTKINTTRLDIAASLNSSIYPVPSLSRLADNSTQSLKDRLCSNIDTSIIDDTAKALFDLGTIAIWVMFIVVLAGWGVLAFWQWRRWKALNDTVAAVQEEWDSAEARGQPTRGAWTVVAVVEHPVLERYARPIFDRLQFSPCTRTNLRWFLSYLGHPTCLTLLFISVVGLIAIEVQLATLHGLQHRAEAETPRSLNASMTDFANQLNALSINASREYAAKMNSVIQGLENRINGEMFGKWINGTAVTLNNTLVTFYSEVQSVLITAFGGMILYTPINTFVYSILGSKITILEKGLTWVSDHVKVSLPLVSEDVLLLPPSTANELATPLASAAVGGNGNGGAVGKLVTHFEKALEVERTIYAILLGVYAVIFLVGLAAVLWDSGGREKYSVWRATGGAHGDSPTPDGPGAAPDLRFGTTTQRPGSWWVPLYLRYNRKKDEHATNKSLPPPPEPEKGRASVDSEPSEESMRSLFAPAQAFLRLHGWPSCHPTPTPSLLPSPLPMSLPLSLVEGGDSEHHWEACLYPERRRTLTVANPSSSTAGPIFRTISPTQSTGAPSVVIVTPTPSRVGTPAQSPPRQPRRNLLPTAERRKREMESTIDPFVDPSIAFGVMERNMAAHDLQRQWQQDMSCVTSVASFNHPLMDPFGDRNRSLFSDNPFEADEVDRLPVPSAMNRAAQMPYVPAKGPVAGYHDHEFGQYQQPVAERVIRDSPITNPFRLLAAKGGVRF